MFRHNALRYAVLALLAAGALFQALTAEYFGLEILTEILILAMLVLALDIVAGFGGMVSLCHGALMGVGAYTYAILSTKAGIAPPVAMAGSIALTGVAAWVIGAICSRSHGIYFIMATLAFGQMAYTVIFKSRWLGGDDGMGGLPRFDLDWAAQPAWLFPPWSLGARCLRKVAEDKVPVAAIVVRLTRNDQTRMALASLRASRAIRVLDVVHLGYMGFVSGATGLIPGPNLHPTAIVLLSASPVVWKLGPQPADGDGLTYVPGPTNAPHDARSFAVAASRLMVRPPEEPALLPSVALIAHLFKEYARSAVVSWSAHGPSTPPHAATALFHAWADVVATIASSRADNTTTLYKRVANKFATWLEAIVVNPATVAWTPPLAEACIAQFCAARIHRQPPRGAPRIAGICTGISASSVKTEFEAIRSVLSLADLPVSLTASSRLKHTLKRIGALDKKRSSPRPPFTLWHFRRIQNRFFGNWSRLKDKPPHFRDFACCNLAFAFCQRGQVSRQLPGGGLSRNTRRKLRIVWKEASKADPARFARDPSGIDVVSAVRQCDLIIQLWRDWLPRGWNGPLFPHMRASFSRVGGPWVYHRGVWLHATKCVSQDTVNKNIGVWCRAAGIVEHLTLHCCRVGMATALFEAGVDMEIIRKLGGWASDAVRVYLRIRHRAMEEATAAAESHSRRRRRPEEGAGSLAAEPPRSRRRLGDDGPSA